MALPHFSKDFLDRLGTGQRRAEPPEADRLSLGRYLAALRSGAPMQWMSDHLSEDERLRGAIYVAVKVLGEQAGAAECCVYEQTRQAKQEDDRGEAGSPLPPDHEICELLDCPNPHETGGELRERQVQQLALTGSSLCIKVRDDFGTPRELWSEPTGTYQPIPLSAVYPNGGYRFLPWFPGPLASIPGVQAAGGVAVPSEEVMAVRYPHPLLPAGEGLSPLHACRLSFDTLEMIDRARMSKLRRGVRPSAVAEVQSGAALPSGEDLTVLRTELQQLLGGPEKAGALALLSPGLSLKEWGSGDVEVGWIESWGQLVGLTLACFGVARSMAFLDDNVTFAELYARLKQFDLFTLSPLLSRLSAAYNRELIWPTWGKRYYVKFKPRKIDNEESTDKRIGRAQASGSITHNEVRTALGWQPTEEAWGRERAFVGKGGAAESGPGEGQQDVAPPAPPYRPEARPVAQARPENPQGHGSLGPRTLLQGARNGNGRH